MTAKVLACFIAAMFLIVPDAGAQTYVADLSCTKGLYRVKLPKSYKALRALGQIRRERVLKTEEHDGYTVTYRELRFNGLELVVATASNHPNQYALSRAIISTSNWRIGGQLRVGAPLKSALRGLPLSGLLKEGELEYSGDTDFLRVSFAAGRIIDVEYSCTTG